MSKKLLAILGILVATIASTGFGHEGHDQAPGVLQANHGGSVLAGSEVNFEYVVSGSQLQMYVLGHDKKDVPVSDVKLAATAKPAKMKAETLKVELQEGVYRANVDFKGSHRVEVNVNVDHQGKKSKFKFQMEN